MEFEQNNNLSKPTEPLPAEPIPGLAASKLATETTRKGTGWRIFFGIVLALSVMANIALFMILIGVITLFAAGQKRIFTEEVIREGPRANKIAVITLEGVIHNEQAKSVYRQLKAARQDKRVKGLILQVNSPGGTISGSDQIHKEILRYRQEKGKPVVAFMEGIAASGGYYTSVACEKIIAEPTVITGSIGVVMGHFVIEELLKDKLGILPVIIKAGEKKDWPSSFQVPTEEQLQYLDEKMITPAYERFVEIVANGRKGLLSLDNVTRLADGSIFSAQEALDEKLIDQIGYLDEAIEIVKSLAGIEDAQVVQYQRVFSWASFLSAKNRNILRIDRATLYELSTPQILYLWSAY